jgi:dUTP pyrophosphatase
MIVFAKLDPEAKLPQYAHSTDSGADLYASEDVDIRPGDYYPVKTGVKVCLPQGYEGQVRSKSGLAAKHGVHVLNSPGTIDNGYRGEIFVILINHGNQTFAVRKGDKVAQFIVSPYAQATFTQTESLPDSERGEGRFGSTGRQ